MEYLRQEMGITREGVSLKGICVAAREIGMQTTACRMSMGSLCEDVTLPCIIHWNQNHFVVVYKIAHGKVYVADPGKGMIHYSMAEFASHWTTDSNEAQATGIALLLEPTDGFYAKPGIKERRGRGMALLRQYATRYRGDMARLLLGLFAVSGIQLLFPFLTQAIVDRGISGRDMHIIWLILLGEVALLTGSTVIDFVRRRILLRVSTQVNISLISDFFTKLMRLPIAFFGYKQTGDLLQRIEDHSRIEQFLTTQAPNVIFAAFSVVTLCTVLGVYSMSILGVFAAGSVLYMLWIMFFLRRRKVLDYQYFEQQADQKDRVYEMIGGMTEIKQQGCEQRKRQQWRQIQDSIFGISRRALALSQTEEAGGICINELTSIVVIIITATAVIDGSLTLGMMLAIQGVIGQLRGPLDDITGYPSLFFDGDTPAGSRSPFEYSYFNRNGRGRIDQFIDNFSECYRLTRDRGYIGLPTANHDFQRLRAGSRNTPDQLRVAMTFLLTMPGIPFVYYGDEIGMRYQPDAPDVEGATDRAGSRTPMQWEPGPTAGFSTCVADSLYLPVSTDGGLLTVRAQAADPRSLLHYVRHLLRLRRDVPALGNEAGWTLLSDKMRPYPWSIAAPQPTMSASSPSTPLPPA